MNAYYFRVKDTDDFFNTLKIESAKRRMSMKKFIIEAVNEKLEDENCSSAVTVFENDNEGTPRTGKVLARG